MYQLNRPLLQLSAGCPAAGCWAPWI